jgi:hypothetical protein
MVMRSGISGKYRRSLAHGAAIVVAGGLLAGCSSDVMRFQDSILTGDSRAMQPAPVAQAYPGDYSQPVDTMSTGSIASAPRRGGILQRAGLVPRPQGTVRAAAAPVWTGARAGRPRLARHHRHRLDAAARPCGRRRCAGASGPDPAARHAARPAAGFRAAPAGADDRR